MTENKDQDKKVKVEYSVQTPGLCGPASLKILLSHFGKNFTEEQLTKLASATMDAGTEHEGMAQAIKEVGGYVFMKENGTIEEIESFIKADLPVIIGWFDKDEDHYSVVVSSTEKNIVIADPSSEVNSPERWLDRATFPNIWFDFVGKDNRTVSWCWYMVVTFEKKKFPEIKGGYYY